MARGFFGLTSVARKYLVAASGLVLLAYVILHLLGNLQVYLGRERLNYYADLLHTSPPLLWAARVILLLAAAVHVGLALGLHLENRHAAPAGYRGRRFREADVASRSMIWGGLAIAAFVVYHVLHFTVGSVHPAFTPGDVYANVVAGFRIWPVSAVYVAANLLLGLHLYHGTWSALQTFGLDHPRLAWWRRAAAVGVALFIAGGNVSIPVAVLAGVVT